jgi:hypothetical protein
VRRAWLAGSLPGTTTEESIDLALSTLGPYLLFLPCPFTGRPNWAASVTEELAKQTDLFSVVRQGGNTDYNDLTVLASKGDLSNLDLGYYDIYRAESEIAQRLIKSYGVALTTQVGIASPFDQSMITVGPGRHLRHYKSFIRATVRDVMKIYTHDESVVFSIEAPYELIGALKSPGMARSLVIRKMVAHVVDFVKQCPQGMRIGIHPCLGDLNHKSKANLPHLTPLVDWVNELCDTWPRGYTLAYVHLPLCEGARPPVVDPGWYTDLKRLRVPEGVRVVLGCCHEHVTASQLQPIVGLADSLLARTVDVGASCGLALRGKRSMDDVYTVLHQQAELCRG